MKRVAIVGAGISGSACAGVLKSENFQVEVFDKARGMGGRMTTRRIDPFQFDLGAQYIFFSSARFKRVLETWADQGIVKAWCPVMNRFANQRFFTAGEALKGYVPVPSMNQLVKHLLQDQFLHADSKITAIKKNGGLWSLDSKGQVFSGFHIIILTMPAPQIIPLIKSSNQEAYGLAKVSYRPCWSVQLGFDKKLPLGFDAATVNDDMVSWMARNTSKPDRPPHESWIIHTAAAWSRKHLEADHGEILSLVVGRFQRLCKINLEPAVANAHRWRYSRVSHPLNIPFLYDEGRGLGLCGDFCSGDSVEHAYLSGIQLAEHLNQQVK
jgi:predicted NAD/FAD-dependent oxidoreductase